MSIKRKYKGETERNFGTEKYKLNWKFTSGFQQYI